MDAVFAKVNKYHVEAVCEGPLHTGCSDGQKGEILVHPVSGKPFIQGSSLAGVFRDFISAAGSDAEKWFGSDKQSCQSDGRSKITFSDVAFSDSKVVVETRPHVKIDPATSSVSSGSAMGSAGKSGHKLDITYVSKGTELSFDIYQFMNENDNDDEVIERCLCAIEKGDIRLGGRLTSGCGILKIKKAERTFFNMFDSSDRKMWTEESKSPDDITEEIRKDNSSSRFTRITVAVKADKLVVRGSYIDRDTLEKFGFSAMYGDKEVRDPDSMPAASPDKHFFVSGSSLKGVFRSHISSVAGYTGDDHCFMDKAFSDKTKSKVFFRDAVLKDENVKIHPVTRNKIDKFTGGTVDKALFKEIEISGKFDFCIEIDNRESDVWNSDDVKRAAALVTLSVRDLAVHTFSIGSGASVGRGYTDVESMTIETAEGKKYTVDFSNSSMDNETKEFIDGCLSMLKGDN